MKHLLTTALILALAAPAYAGGPVIVEDATETVAPRQERKIGGLVVGALVILAIAALANGGGNCTAPEPEPQPVDPCQ